MSSYDLAYLICCVSYRPHKVQTYNGQDIDISFFGFKFNNPNGLENQNYTIMTLKGQHTFNFHSVATVKVKCRQRGNPYELFKYF